MTAPRLHSLLRRYAKLVLVATALTFGAVGVAARDRGGEMPWFVWGLAFLVSAVLLFLLERAASVHLERAEVLLAADVDEVRLWVVQVLRQLPGSPQPTEEGHARFFAEVPRSSSWSFSQRIDVTLTVSQRVTSASVASRFLSVQIADWGRVNRRNVRLIANALKSFRREDGQPPG